MRRSATVILLGGLLAVLLGAYIVYSRRVVRELRRDAGRYGAMYARVYQALTDPTEESGNTALLALSQQINELGVPVVITDTSGMPTAAVNLPFSAPLTDPRVRTYVASLDRQNAPVVEPGIGEVHFGDSVLITSLRFIPLLLASLLVLTGAAIVYVVRTRSRADRERVWAGMARESAHQLATPLSSLSGWIELLRDHAADEVSASAARHMEADLERLERVSHRFERIGRPPRRDTLDLGDLVVRVGAYFQARVPTLAHAVTLEVLVKNGLDALAGRGGRLYMTTKRLDPDRVRVRVADDGPGVPRELRTRIFEPGYSTKQSGWGIGLSLAKRIVEENHGGRLMLAPSEKGATFDVILQG